MFESGIRQLRMALSMVWGRPINPKIGLGDLLVYGLFITAAYKGFGREGAL